MTENQYKRANMAVFPILLTLVLLNSGMLLAMLVLDSATINTYVQLLVYFVTAIIIITAYITNREKYICSLILYMSGGIIYMVMMCFNMKQISFIYALPIVFSYIAYLNKRLMYISNIVVILAYIIQCVRLSMAGVSDQYTMIIGIIVMFLSAFATIRVTRLLLQFF